MANIGTAPALPGMDLELCADVEVAEFHMMEMHLPALCGLSRAHLGRGETDPG